MFTEGIEKVTKAAAPCDHVLRAFRVYLLLSSLRQREGVGISLGEPWIVLAGVGILQTN